MNFATTTGIFNPLMFVTMKAIWSNTSAKLIQIVVAHYYLQNSNWSEISTGEPEESEVNLQEALRVRLQSILTVLNSSNGFNGLERYQDWARLYVRLGQHCFGKSNFKKRTGLYSTWIVPRNFNTLYHSTRMMFQSVTRCRLSIYDGQKRTGAAIYSLSGMVPQTTTTPHWHLEIDEHLFPHSMNPMQQRNYIVKDTTHNLLENTASKVYCQMGVVFAKKDIYHTNVKIQKENTHNKSTYKKQLDLFWSSMTAQESKQFLECLDASSSDATEAIELYKEEYGDKTLKDDLSLKFLNLYPKEEVEKKPYEDFNVKSEYIVVFDEHVRKMVVQRSNYTMQEATKAEHRTIRDAFIDICTAQEVIDRITPSECVYLKDSDTYQDGNSNKWYQAWNDNLNNALMEKFFVENDTEFFAQCLKATVKFKNKDFRELSMEDRKKEFQAIMTNNRKMSQSGAINWRKLALTARPSVFFYLLALVRYSCSSPKDLILLLDVIKLQGLPSTRFKLSNSIACKVDNVLKSEGFTESLVSRVTSDFHKFVLHKVATFGVPCNLIHQVVFDKLEQSGSGSFKNFAMSLGHRLLSCIQKNVLTCMLEVGTLPSYHKNLNQYDNIYRLLTKYPQENALKDHCCFQGSQQYSITSLGLILILIADAIRNGILTYSNQDQIQDIIHVNNQCVKKEFRPRHTYSWSRFFNPRFSIKGIDTTVNGKKIPRVFPVHSLVKLILYGNSSPFHPAATSLYDKDGKNNELRAAFSTFMKQLDEDCGCYLTPSKINKLINDGAFVDVKKKAGANKKRDFKFLLKEEITPLWNPKEGMAYEEKMEAMDDVMKTLLRRVCIVQLNKEILRIQKSALDDLMQLGEYWDDDTYPDQLEASHFQGKQFTTTKTGKRRSEVLPCPEFIDEWAKELMTTMKLDGASLQPQLLDKVGDTKSFLQTHKVYASLKGCTLDPIHNRPTIPRRTPIHNGPTPPNRTPVKFEPQGFSTTPLSSKYIIDCFIGWIEICDHRGEFQSFVSCE